jgi:hypothetical protein
MWTMGCCTIYRSFHTPTHTSMQGPASLYLFRYLHSPLLLTILLWLAGRYAQLPNLEVQTHAFFVMRYTYFRRLCRSDEPRLLHKRAGKGGSERKRCYRNVRNGYCADLRVGAAEKQRFARCILCAIPGHKCAVWEVRNVKFLFRNSRSILVLFCSRGIEEHEHHVFIL